jgi:predicted dehydrogenase
MRAMTRRDCLRCSLAAAGAGAASALPRAVRSQALGSNNDVRVAVVGIQRRGPQLIELFRKLPDVRVVALCDADRRFVDREVGKFERRNEKVDGCADFRRLLDRKDVDALVLATPNHWHALMAVWACQAGKDVYVEKPVSHTIREGRKMVQAARKHRRIVQAGTQNRSCTGLRQALAYVREGHLGEMKLVRGFDYPARQSIGKVDGPQPVPKTVDYDLYQGPAPLRPLRRKRLHYDWHWVWETGDGDCGNRGVHTLDHIRWFIDQPHLPPRVISIAGRLGWDDDGETPNAQVTLLDYEPVPILWEMMTLPKRVRPAHIERLKGMWGSMVIEFEGGYLAGHRGGATAADRAGRLIRQFRGDGGVTHPANFVAAMRSRKPHELRAEVLDGHVSTALCHLANISYLVGCRRSPERIAKALADNELLGDSLSRLVKHVELNQVDLAETPLTLGSWLTVDTKAERFVGEAGEWANMYLSRTYRRPFAMPEKV